MLVNSAGADPAPRGTRHGICTLPLPRSFGDLDASKSAPARKAALLRPFGGTDFSGVKVSRFERHR
jgi:hypothetical protein